LTEGKSM